MRQYVFLSHAIAALVLYIGIFSPPFTKEPEERVENILEIRKTDNVALAATTHASCGENHEVYQRGIASWYGEYFHGRTMANGKPYNMYGYTVAHRTLRLGTEICITNPQNGRSVRAVVTDRGPYVEPRIVDLSMQIAQDLDIGLGNVEIALR